MHVILKVAYQRRREYQKKYKSFKFLWNEIIEDGSADSQYDLLQEVIAYYTSNANPYVWIPLTIITEELSYCANYGVVNEEECKSLYQMFNNRQDTEMISLGYSWLDAYRNKRLKKQSYEKRKSKGL